MSNENGLLAGYAKVDITPDYQIGLAGYGNQEKRRSQGIAEHIYVTCIALTDGDETILLYTADMLSCPRTVADEIRDVVSAATKIPNEKIFIAATHTHVAPAISGYPEGGMYKSGLLEAMAKCAKLALEDRAPAKIMAGKKEISGMNFVRHVQLENGVVAGAHWKRYHSPVVGFFGPADNQIVLLKFAREEKKDILLINWQGHPDCPQPDDKDMLSPSYPGPLRDTVEAGSGMQVAYFTGADGDMVIDSLIPEYKHSMRWRRYGVKMGAMILEMLDDLEEVEGTGITTERAIVEVDINHSWDHKLDQAVEVVRLWKATDRATADPLANQYDFSSVYHARSVAMRARMDKTTEMEINAFRVGGVGFTTGTYEMYAESGIQIKEASPFEYTFLLTGNASYVPSDMAFDHRVYETDTCLYARGTAEKLVDKYLELLKKVK